MPASPLPKIQTVNATKLGVGRGTVRVPASAPVKTAPAGADLERVLKAAQFHGQESGQAHQVGDLEDFLRLCWPRMTREAQQQALAEHAESLETWEVR